ncbi:MAG TPA: tyrosine--tRNA ligase [Gemmatimonadales bacterium]|nr:tyrosine--tRNA ligase [Gemmatimonadales bacterium]
MTSLLETLTERGLLQDATPGAAERLAAGPITGYVGFDPTADSLHVGSLIPVMGLAWLQRLGGSPIVLVGGGTGMVGDPSGKRTERPVMSTEQIDSNARALAQQIGRFLRFDGPRAAVVVDNASWLRELSLMEFLRDTGRHFTVNYMLQKESVKSRMETGISFTEFSYMLIQAYDFWQLFRTRGCELQMGGSDQWGNITAGIELVARREQRQVHGIVLPLLATASGAKFGKSEGGNVWLDPARTNPYQFYQFWLNTDDRDAERFLRYFTFLPLDEIAAAMTAHAADPGRRGAQRLLAREVTALVHGAEEAERAVSASAAIFGAGAAEADYAELAATMPNCTVSGSELEAGLPLVDALVRAGLAASKSEGRRGIQGRGFSVNDVPETDVARRLSTGDLRENRYILLRKGKKTYAMLVVAG